MTAETVKSFWTNLTLSINIDLPAIILFVMLLLSGYVMFMAQRREDFDFGNMLRDEQGKESTVRICALISMAVSSWALMNHALLAGASMDWKLFALYVGTWSGALVFIKMAERWDGHLPWSK